MRGKKQGKGHWEHQLSSKNAYALSLMLNYKDDIQGINSQKNTSIH